jgi:hypothetical protein
MNQVLPVRFRLRASFLLLTLFAIASALIFTSCGSGWGIEAAAPAWKYAWSTGEIYGANAERRVIRYRI